MRSATGGGHFKQFGFPARFMEIHVLQPQGAAACSTVYYALFVRTKRRARRVRTKRRARRDLRQRREKAALAARAHLVRQLQQAEQVGQAEVLAAQHLGETTALAGVGERVQVAHQSLLASAVLDQVYGDRSSFFFYHRDQPAHTPTLISSLQLPGQPGLAADLTTPNGVRSACQAFEHHYSAAAPAGVYAAKAIDPAARATLLNCLTSRLTPAQARAAEGPGGDPMLSEEELGRALQGSAHSKAPGLDGLPMEVYDRLWPQLVGPLRAMLREALADTSDPAPLAEFLTGVITLVPKAGKPRDQSAFILGRDINDSVQFHLGLLEWLQQRHSPAWLLLLDLAGAYDNVSWSLLQDTLVAMGFSQQGHVRWAQLLHRGATSQVLVNGYLTDSFPLASGLLQGSGASPLYWCVVLQPLVSYLSSLQRAGRITTPAIPTSPLAMHAATLTPALPTKEYADDLTILVADRVKDGEVVVEALVRFRAAGGPALSVSKSVALPCVQPMTGEAAYGGAAAAITAASLPWQPLGLNLLGRVQVAQQCLASKVVYQMAAVQPPTALAQAMALAIKRFVAASDLPQERSPNSNRLYPSEAICVMPRREGGVGLPDLGVISTAMRAKMLAQLWSPRVRPWQPLTHSLLADPSHGLSTWVITDPSAPPSRNITPRLQAHVAALAQLRLFRVVPPESQSLYSVMAEPLWFNPLIRLIPSARQEAEGQGWTHVRHVREALQRQSQHEGVTRWAADLVRACLPEPWQQWVDLRDPPPPDWECLRVGPGVGFVARCHPALHPSHWVAPNGRLFPLNPTGQGPLGTFQVVEGAVWEPAAVARLNKPNYLLTPEERATHLRPLPAGRLGGQGQEGGQGQGQEEWLLGPWAHLQLDPQVWGLGTTTLLEFTVRDAKVRLHQLQRVSVDALYPPGGGLWPVLWGRRPPREAGVAQGTAVDGEAFRELEERWQASAQQVTAQRAAEEREQQGRDAEELLPEEVQGSQAPRWRDTSARAPPRPSPEQRAAERAERQLEAQQGPRRTGRQPATLQVPPDGMVDELAAAARPGQSCLQVWKELMDPTLRREHAIVAWRVLHGSLMVGALWGHILKGAAAPGSSDCRLCQPGQLETLTHAFLTCPAVAPVWEWVLDVYGHLTGTRPPSGDALLLLSGRPTRSEAPPFQPSDSLLWLRLRVAFLGTVWRLRSSGAATALQPQMVAQRVAEEVVLTLSSAVKRDWHRVGRDIRVGLCGAVPSTWFRGTDPELGADQFDRLWPEPSGGWFAKEGAEERALERDNRCSNRCTQDCTTNPSLVLKAAQSSEYAHLLQGALAAQKAHKGPAISADPTRPFAGEMPFTPLCWPVAYLLPAAVADLLAVDLGCQMLDIVRGRVSTEVDAHLSYDSTATYDKALHLVDLYAKRGVGLERLYIKIASTWEGIEACRRLQAQGIDCNMTLLFSFAQAAACADAGAALISPFVGRIMDWYKAKEGREFAPEEDPGVLSVKRIYTYYKTHSYPTIVMAASFRNVGEIRELAGCDNITISPQLLAELEACSDPLPRKLHPGMRDDSLTKLVISKASFDTLHSADAMAVEKLAQGIEGFAADQRKLEAMLAQAAGNA
ncbi:hypothetical protein QJQ45_028863 [Haematococcus lacustris]|nr:hypothetical protein QJQ45_028863 [Haematococcus lacustris]